jgi:RNA polymerase sigma-70 factor (ECF subfamily)
MIAKTNEQLMELHQRGDPAAFDEIYRRHRGGVEGLIVNMLTKYAPQLLSDTADLVQDVFAFIHAHRQLFIGGSRFTPWLYTTAKRLTQNHVRDETKLRRDYRRTVHLHHEDRDSSRFDAANYAVAEKVAAEHNRAVAVRLMVEHGLHQLPNNNLQQVIRLVYLNGLTSDETAKRLGVPVSTVNWWRRESLALMRVALEEPEPTAE